MIEYVEYDMDELPDSDFAKASAIIFDKIDHGKDGVLTSSNFVDLIETLGEVFNSEDLEGHLRQVESNIIGSLDCFPFVRWYVDDEVFLESA